MKYEQVIQVIDDLLLMLSKHRCVADLTDTIKFYRTYVDRLYLLCSESEKNSEAAEESFQRCFRNKKNYNDFVAIVKEIRRRTTAQLTTGMPMFRQKARQSIALRNKHLRLSFV